MTPTVSSSSSSSSTDKTLKTILDLLQQILAKLTPITPPPPPPVDHGCTADQVWDEVQQKCVPKPVTPPGPIPTKPTEGTVKDWGGNPDPNTWAVVHMKNDPTKFKVVDDKAINIAADFTAQAIAQQYIDYYLYIQGNPPHPHPHQLTTVVQQPNIGTKQLKHVLRIHLLQLVELLMSKAFKCFIQTIQQW